MGFLKEIDRRLNTLLSFIFPADIYCICCGRPIYGGSEYSLCSICLRMIRWVAGNNCEKCGCFLPEESRIQTCSMCREGPRSFERGYSCMQYGRLERGIIHRFKYGEQPYIAPALARILAHRLEASELISTDESSKGSTDSDGFIIIPVPMFPEKEQIRGYNQACLLALRLSEITGIKCLPHLLGRIQDTLPMSRLDPWSRRENVKDAFRVMDSQVLKGRSIILVDDVYTTGSTVDACSEALLKGGAERVYAVVLTAGTDREMN